MPYSNKKWRTENPDKAREIRKRNYAKGRIAASNGKNLWLPEHVSLILTSELTDRQLALQLRRSVQAIQVKRCDVLKRQSSTSYASAHPTF